MDKATQTDEVENHADRGGFPYFRRLPPELRAMVWVFYFLGKYYDGSPRIHVLRNWRGPRTGYDDSWWRTTGYRMPIPTSTLMADTNELCYQPPTDINREAYYIAKTMKLPTAYPPQLNWSEDLIYCASSSRRPTIAFLRDNFESVQNVAVTMEQDHLTLLKLRLQDFRAIKLVYFVMKPSEPIATDLPRDKYGFVEWDDLYNTSSRGSFVRKNLRQFKPWFSGHMVQCNGPVTAKVVVDVDHCRPEGPQYDEGYARLLR